MVLMGLLLNAESKTLAAKSPPWPAAFLLVPAQSLGSRLSVICLRVERRTKGVNTSQPLPPPPPPVFVQLYVNTDPTRCLPPPLTPVDCEGGCLSLVWHAAACCLSALPVLVLPSPEKQIKTNTAGKLATSQRVSNVPPWKMVPPTLDQQLGFFFTAISPMQNLKTTSRGNPARDLAKETQCSSCNTGSKSHSSPRGSLDCLPVG